jgi:hypothetical protein
MVSACLLLVAISFKNIFGRRWIDIEKDYGTGKIYFDAERCTY